MFRRMRLWREAEVIRGVTSVAGSVNRKDHLFDLEPPVMGVLRMRVGLQTRDEIWKMEKLKTIRQGVAG